MSKICYTLAIKVTEVDDESGQVLRSGIYSVSYNGSDPKVLASRFDDVLEEAKRRFNEEV